MSDKNQIQIPYRKSYIVRYTHPSLGPRASSRWGREGDAVMYMSGLPDEWKATATIESSEDWPEIFPHCKDSIAQAVGGCCFGCKKQLTEADAKVYRAWGEK